MVSPQDRADLLALDAKINALLPPQYQNCYDAVKPVSMGSATLVFGPDGKVAWDQIWTSFCELALAGGPPHRGALLEPVSAEVVFAAHQKYQSVVAEIGRGIWTVTELPVLPHVAPGWVGVRCLSEGMASWLVKAIIVENISARRENVFLYLPAGPHFQLGKEIKNVVTAMAKTHHYWTYHMPSSALREGAVPEFLEPALPWEAADAEDAYKRVVAEMGSGIAASTGLTTVHSPYLGWIGIQCGDVDRAVWLMRALVVENFLVRRENEVVYLPANPKFIEGDRIRVMVETFTRACRLWKIHLGV